MNHRQIIKTSILYILVGFALGCKTSSRTTKLNNASISVEHIETDTLYKSNQRICILSLDNKLLNKHTIEIGYNNNELETTSQIAIRNHAVAAINGSFFDADNGGSVTYFEKNNSVISKTRTSELKWGKPDSLINGVIICKKNNKLKIQSAKTDQFYEKSKKEAFAIVSGPLLLSNSILQKLPNMKFVHKRHPRTCLCKTKDKILFITIDGRSEKADGMSLIETQKYLKDMGCVDAINLDGGGSTAMWTKNNGIENKPSDENGERVVSNAILILKKK